ncbi:MAG: hypothetical protein V4617_10325 [Gemmatimonadota bacterium]
MLDDQDGGDERTRGPHGDARSDRRRDGRRSENGHVELPNGDGRGGTPGAVRDRDVTGRIETSREPRTERVHPTGEPDVATVTALPDEAISTRTAAVRVTDYLFIAIYGLLGLRLLTALLDVRGDAGFGRAVTALTDPLYTPFRGIVANPTDDTGRMLALPVLIALTAYMIVHALISAGLRAARRNAPDSVSRAKAQTNSRTNSRTKSRTSTR